MNAISIICGIICGFISYAMFKDGEVLPALFFGACCIAGISYMFGGPTKVADVFAKVGEIWTR
ncbi:hypothetical protein MJD09_05105 [bacterium]|nr:hypothetical protein [bacterium]